MGKKIEILNTIELWPIDRLQPYERNARTHSPEQVAKISASIVEFGFTNPILVDGKDGVIAGHGRLMAAQRLKLAQVPVVVLDHLTDAQRRAYILADNRLALDAGWDDEMLAQELADLQAEGFNVELTGFSDEELQKMLSDNGTGGDEEDEQSGEDPYTKKIKAPIYTPTGEKPALEELFDKTKTEELEKEIDESELPDDIKTFLRCADQRHTIFNFERIAEFYCHSKKPVQELFEKSALVIIDFNKAIENGFVVLSKRLMEEYQANDE